MSTDLRGSNRMNVYNSTPRSRQGTFSGPIPTPRGLLCGQLPQGQQPPGTKNNLFSSFSFLMVKGR